MRWCFMTQFHTDQRHSTHHMRAIITTSQENQFFFFLDFLFIFLRVSIDFVEDSSRFWFPSRRCKQKSLQSRGKEMREAVSLGDRGGRNSKFITKCLTSSSSSSFPHFVITRQRRPKVEKRVLIHKWKVEALRQSRSSNHWCLIKYIVVSQHERRHANKYSKTNKVSLFFPPVFF